MKPLQRLFVTAIMAALMAAVFAPAATAGSDTRPVIVDLSAPATPDQLSRLAAAGLKIGVAYENLPAVSGNLAPGRAVSVATLPFVMGVRTDSLRTPHAVRQSLDLSPVPIESNYFLDFIDREKTDATGEGVYVAVLDGGLVPSWRDYLDPSKVRVDLGKSFTGHNGNPVPYTLENDRGGHGVAVAATIIGYTLHDKRETGQFLNEPATGTPGHFLVPGVAPGATIIPIKVCDIGMYCWDSSIYAGLDYIVSLKKGTAANGELMGAPFVINLSLGGPGHSEAEENLFKAVAAAGVLIVASAGNDGPNPMGWPGAYPVVISVGVGGWRKQWYGAHDYLNNQWWMDDVGEDEASIDEWFMVWWSGVENPDMDQELDVVATGRFMLLPYLWSGRATVPADPVPADGIPSEYTFISGTSFSAPTTTGVVALMLSVMPNLTQAQAEMILRSTALPIPEGSWAAGFPYPHDNAWDASKSLGGPGHITGWGLVQADGAVEAARTL